MNVFSPEEMKRAPAGFKAVPWARKDGGPLDGMLYSLQVAPDDCTGCGICVDVCPTRSKEVVKHKAINMAPKLEHLEAERANYDFFLSLPEVRPSFDTIDGLRGSQLRMPLFEYSGACSGCGETPYVKLLSQLYGDHLMVANATGCSSIYGGNLPTTPWSQNAARPGTGLGEQPVRGQRRVRAGHAAGARRAARSGADAGARTAQRDRRGTGRRAARGAAGQRRADHAAARARRSS